MEDRIGPRSLRAVVVPPALEVRIDMPYPGHGSNSGRPPTREPCHQRMGRVGAPEPCTS